MTTPMTPERLAEIRAAAEQATPEKWSAFDAIRVGNNKRECFVQLSDAKAEFDSLVCVLLNRGSGRQAKADARFIALARSAVPELLAEVERLRAERRYIEWLFDGEVGTSSRTIWRVLSGVDDGRENGGAPMDADDFSRCYKLIARFPEWRSRLAEVAALSPDWKRVIDNWDALSGLYEQWLSEPIRYGAENGHKMYELINGRSCPGPSVRVTFPRRRRGGKAGP